MSKALTLGRRVSTTIARELLVAVTGVVMIGFLLGHLGGNFLIFAGPDVFNAYAENLHSLGPLLWVARIGLILAFVSHISSSVSLYLANRKSRGRYAVTAYLGRKTWATRFMIFSGITIFFFLFILLNVFTFGD
jgi:succinate dehydrogenase / fumarate reductase cytochrome b subunit